VGVGDLPTHDRIHVEDEGNSGACAEDARENRGLFDGVNQIVAMLRHQPTRQFVQPPVTGKLLPGNTDRHRTNAPRATNAVNAYAGNLDIRSLEIGRDIDCVTFSPEYLKQIAHCDGRTANGEKGMRREQQDSHQASLSRAAHSRTGEPSRAVSPSARGTRSSARANPAEFDKRWSAIGQKNCGND